MSRKLLPICAFLLALSFAVNVQAEPKLTTDEDMASRNQSKWSRSGDFTFAVKWLKFTWANVNNHKSPCDGFTYIIKYHSNSSKYIQLRCNLSLSNGVTVRTKWSSNNVKGQRQISGTYRPGGICPAGTAPRKIQRMWCETK